MKQIYEIPKEYQEKSQNITDVETCDKLTNVILEITQAAKAINFEEVSRLKQKFVKIIDEYYE